jgi:hypothetical protein
MPLLGKEGIAVAAYIARATVASRELDDCVKLYLDAEASR